jgi:hypothetical protein
MRRINSSSRSNYVLALPQCFNAACYVLRASFRPGALRYALTRVALSMLIAAVLRGAYTCTHAASLRMRWRCVNT